MGLDCIFVVPDGIADPGVAIQLAGTSIFGFGDSGFRGKYYAELVEDITGISLYEERLSSFHVEEIASKLEGVDLSNHDCSEFAIRHNRGAEACPCQDFKDLKAMFRAYANVGAGLISGY